jgi:hypothetical protein
MSVKIRQCFLVTDRIRVEDRQHFEREEVGDDKATATKVAYGGQGGSRRATAAVVAGSKVVAVVDAARVWDAGV